MDRRVLISVVIPIFKAENYLSRCIDSFLCQTMKDFELILVDDGSPDKSGEICDEYTKKDTRIKVIHKNNGGVGSARQCGVINSIGEYIIQADPDDWVAPNMLEELYNTAIKEYADVVICDYYYDNGIDSSYKSQKPVDLHYDSLLREFLLQKLHGGVWNKLIKYSCFTKYAISFPQNMNLWEDQFVICSLLLHNLNISYLPKAFYYYDNVSNSNSLTHKITKKSLDSMMYFIDYFERRLDIANYFEEFYHLKKIVKELGWTTMLLSASKTYSEINTVYLNREKPHFMSSKWRLCQCLKGRGYIVIPLQYFIEKIIVPLYYCIKK